MMELKALCGITSQSCQTQSLVPKGRGSSLVKSTAAAAVLPLLLALVIICPAAATELSNTCPVLETITPNVPIPNQLCFDSSACLSPSSNSTFCFSPLCFNPACFDASTCPALSCLPQTISTLSASSSNSSCSASAYGATCLNPSCLEGLCLHAECINRTCLQQLCSSNNTCFNDTCLVPATEDVITAIAAPSNCTGLPANWTDYSRLTYLNFAHLRLAEIPPELCTLTNLQHLLLGFNSFTSIPDCLSSLANLKSLHLQHNKISGPLPNFWGSFTNLESLYLQDNSITGDLPPSLLDASQLKVIKLSDNHLQGDFTSFLGNLTSLPSILDFSLNDNDATGSLPAALGSVSTLQYLDISSNNIQQGVYPKCMASFPNLFYLNTTGKNGENSIACPSYKDTGSCCNGSKPVMTSTFCTQHCQSFCSKCNNPPLDESAVIAIALCSAAAVAVILSISIWFLLNRLYFNKKLSEWEEALKHGAFHRFSLADIKLSTNDFARRNRIGEGGFGVVYRGNGPKGQKWAVKRGRGGPMDDTSMGFFEKEVLEVSRLKHRNLIRLLGYCCEAKEQILVYELAPYGSLDQHLYSEFRSFYLNFRQRLDLALGVADGLAYLHHHVSPGIIHRDIKPGNILLDENLEAKVADFGLLKNIDDAQASFITRVVGTQGYLDPDYYDSQRVTPRVDVYSYGVVLLELVTGRPATTKSLENADLRVHISEWAVPRVKEGDIKGIADERMLTESNAQFLLEVAQIAVKCLHTPSKERPNMMEVAAALRGIEKHVMMDAGEDVSELDELSSETLSTYADLYHVDIASSDHASSSCYNAAPSGYINFSGPMAH